MCGGDGTARDRFSAFEGVRAWAHEAPCGMAGRRLHDSLQIVRVEDERAGGVAAYPPSCQRVGNGG